jgi:hypothetical protein
MSTFGVMFTPDQDKAAAEMARVCMPGGRIGLANWTPGSFVGELFKLMGRYVVPAAGVKSPALWGTEARLREMFATQLKDISIERRDFVFRYHSAAHWLEIFRTFYGPMQKAFGALDAEHQESLAADLLALAERFNRATDGTLVAPSEYVEVVIKRR